ncbi:MAG: hypothetical protein ABWZ88_15275 [Variovorax sp.]
MGLIYLLAFELMGVLTAVAVRILINRRRMLRAASLQPPAEPVQETTVAEATIEPTAPVVPPPVAQELPPAAPTVDTEQVLAAMNAQSESLREATRSLQALSDGLLAALDRSGSSPVATHAIPAPREQETFFPEEPAPPARQEAMPIEIDFDLSEDAKILQDLAAQLEEAGDVAGALKIRRDLEVDEKWAELTRGDRS